MKKTIAILLVLCLCVGLCACGDISAVDECKILIGQIGDVSLDSEPIIIAAEAAYNNLSVKDQQKLSAEASTLQLARKAYDTLIDSTYAEAVSLFKQNDYKAALEVFQKIASENDSAAYICSCMHAIQAQENFQGNWRWDSGFEYDNSNDVIMHAWNGYDTYVIDFSSQTITLVFKSSTTEYEQAHNFEILNGNVLRCYEFRGDKDSYIYWNYSNGTVSITRYSEKSLPMVKID